MGKRTERTWNGFRDILCSFNIGLTRWLAPHIFEGESMTFDIHQLDEIDALTEEGEESLYQYQDALIELFYESAEGEHHRKTFPEMGFWSTQLIYYGYSYIGVTIPQMTVAFVDEIITDIFPRKISLFSPDDARETIPELIAFWEFLKREFELPNSKEILKYLKGTNIDEFVNMMNDPSRFDMAKSFFMAGQAAGFDMTDEKDINSFMHLHNAVLMADSEGLINKPVREIGRRRQEKAKERQKRKAAKATRKRSRRRKKRK
jgi:hypothetical protein